MGTPRRLNEADANFLVMGEASGMPVVPVSITVYERAYDDPSVQEHLTEVMARLMPNMFQRIAKDRFSTALPRFEDVPGFDPADQALVLPAPGDGTLQPIIEWAQEWGRLPLPLDRPPWRSVTFEDVTVDGVPGRMVVVSQFHHALMDGQGAVAMGEHFYQFAPDGDLPEMPPPVEPNVSTPWEQWRSGWASEGAKARQLLRNAGRRARFAASNPSAALTRARELAQAAKRLQAATSPTPLSPLLRRTSQRDRFDYLPVDIDALRAGARTLGASANDGLMAAVSVALHRYHLDHGVRVPELRVAMPISARTADAAAGGNELVGAIIRLPLTDDVDTAIKECQAVSRMHRDDNDVFFIMDRSRALLNRMPKKVVGKVMGTSMQGLDLSLSNVKGMPVRAWVGGVEILDSTAFLIGGPAVAMTLISGAGRASLGVVTCPEAITDPEHLMDHVAEGINAVCALVNP